MEPVFEDLEEEMVNAFGTKESEAEKKAEEAFNKIMRKRLTQARKDKKQAEEFARMRAMAVAQKESKERRRIVKMLKIRKEKE